MATIAGMTTTWQYQVKIVVRIPNTWGRFACKQIRIIQNIPDIADLIFRVIWLWLVLLATLNSSIYPSTFTNVRFWTKIEFLNILFHKNDHKIIVKCRGGGGGDVSSAAG